MHPCTDPIVAVEPEHHPLQTVLLVVPTHQGGFSRFGMIRMGINQRPHGLHAEAVVKDPVAWSEQRVKVIHSLSQIVQTPPDSLHLLLSALGHEGAEEGEELELVLHLDDLQQIRMPSFPL